MPPVSWRRESAPGSDPGLCVAAPALLTEAERLIAFGQAAKQQVLSKEAAYLLGDELGVHLSEHGGSGQGVVGALAGAGLRLGGNDGRLKGKLQVGSAGAVVHVHDLCGPSAGGGGPQPDRRNAERLRSGPTG